MLLEVKNLNKKFHIKNNFLMTTTGLVQAVDDVSFSLGEAKTVGVVGESGCGKTTLAKILAGLITADSGEIFLNGKDVSSRRNFSGEFQLVFQDSFNSLDPRMNVLDIIAEPLVVSKDCFGKDVVVQKVVDLLLLVGLKKDDVLKYPSQLSGGQRQRINIARALASSPKIIICDEPVSNLDVSVGAQILNLLLDIQKKTKTAYIFISHDLRIVEHVSDDVLVMQNGKIVESAASSCIWKCPTHPYTKKLLGATF